MSTRITAVIITHNEAANIGRCLESLRGVADEVIVADSHSTDDTLSICAKYGAIVHQGPWLGYSGMKNWANSFAANDWILSIDADEEISPALKTALLAWKETTPRNASMKRLSFYCGRWIYHSGWYPDTKWRLFNRALTSWLGDIHETLQGGASEVLLQGDLHHYSFTGISDHLQRSDKYARLAAETMFAKGKSISVPMIILKSITRFFKCYITKQGFRDGVQGLVISAISAQEVLLKYSRLYLMRKGQKL